LHGKKKSKEIKEIKFKEIEEIEQSANYPGLNYRDRCINALIRNQKKIQDTIKLLIKNK
jgi:hypothetical protein